MTKRFAYFYLMKREPEKIKKIVPAHIDYWGNYKQENYLGGPFADRSGGLITFDASDINEAANIIKNDPFALNDLLESRWIKEWMTE
ncbi:MAG: hypothetical protein JSW63_01425 [Ignavibacterium sp.]|nr:MAG: hypothetical protein JSW63_01425 [Ignavibacterium sp.]